jgi:hypothetical protein
MEDSKVFSLISKILPLASFYPRWAQAIFFVTLVFLLITIAIFVTLYSSASTRQKEAEEAAREEKLSGDTLREIEANIKDADQLFADLAAGLSGYYASAASLRMALLDYTTSNPDVASYTEKALPDGLRRDVEYLEEKLTNIRTALAAIQRHRFAVLCWVRAANSLQRSALGQIRDSLIKSGFTEKEATINPADISSLQQFLDLAVRRLGGFTFGPLLAAVLATNSADIPAVGKAYDNAALRTFVFGGNVIFGFVTPSKKTPGETLVVSWGSAILLDIYDCFLTEAIVRAELAARYNNASKAIQKLDINITADKSISSDFSDSAAELNNRRELLFLVLPASKG